MSFRRHGSDTGPMSIRSRLRVGALAAAALASCGPGPLPFEWPPAVGERYPDLQLEDAGGERVTLSSFEGKVIFIEPIGMTCGACNAFAGANEPSVGGFRGQRPQADMPSMDDAASTYGGVSLDDDRIVFVHLLLYGPDMAAPTRAEAQEWAQHFGLDDRPNHVVLVGDERMLSEATRAMIPGLQVVDREFVLRYDGAGRTAPDDLWSDLWPGVGDLL